MNKHKEKMETQEKIYNLAVEYYDGRDIHENFLLALKEQFDVEVEG